MRILAIDDSPAVVGKVLCIGVLTNGSAVEGVLSFHVAEDGEDAAEKMVAAVRKSRFGKHVRLVMTNGVTFGGLNILDVERIVAELHVPWIGVVRRRPGEGRMAAAVGKAFSDKRLISRKIVLLRNSGAAHAAGKVFFQAKGLGAEEAMRLLLGCGGYPEGLRLAHLIATAVVKGESHGRS